MKKRIECKVFGRVQMVMYRDFAARKARALGVVGEVKNEDDSTVSLVGEGEEEKLLAFVDELKKGSFLSHVERVDVGWKESMGEFKDFHIKYENL
ncbi:MAG: acylphosphatase [bacterium]|nr:acylphosphatase [bacterium]